MAGWATQGGMGGWGLTPSPPLSPLLAPRAPRAVLAVSLWLRAQGQGSGGWGSVRWDVGLGDGVRGSLRGLGLGVFGWGCLCRILMPT